MTTVRGKSPRYSPVTGLPLVSLPAEEEKRHHSLQRTRYKHPNASLEDYLLGADGGIAVREYKFDATDEEFRSVLGCVNAPDALLLLHFGVRSAEDAETLLRRGGHTSLLRDYRDLSAAAAEVRIAPAAMIEFMTYTDSSARLSSEAPDALRTFALERRDIPALSFYNSYAELVLRGDARYTDIRTIGTLLLHRHSDMIELTDALYKLAHNASAAGYTAEHLRRVIERRMASGMQEGYGEALLKLTMLYGGDFALNIRHPLLVTSLLGDAPLPSQIENGRRLIGYIDAVADRTESFGMTELRDCIVLLAHDIDPAVAAEGIAAGRSGTQIAGMAAGLEPSLTGGWL